MLRQCCCCWHPVRSKHVARLVLGSSRAGQGWLSGAGRGWCWDRAGHQTTTLHPASVALPWRRLQCSRCGTLATRHRVQAVGCSAQDTMWQRCDVAVLRMRCGSCRPYHTPCCGSCRPCHTPCCGSCRPKCCGERCIFCAFGGSAESACWLDGPYAAGKRSPGGLVMALQHHVCTHPRLAAQHLPPWAQLSQSCADRG